jgi:hypothetical protein
VSLARLLAHYETPESPHETLVELEVCQELARRLCAEKISRRLYRMLDPDSVFPVRVFCDEQRRYKPERLGRGEIVGGLKLVPPASARTQTNVPRSRYLPRFREVFGDCQLAASL